MAGSAAGMQAEAAGTAPAQQAADQRSSTAQLKISINLAARSLALYRDTDKIRLYPIGPGAADTPTPVGYYKIQEKDVNPTWTDPDTGVSIPSGPDNPLGYRWMTLKGNIGIHGTNRPDSVGHLVSHGCIRMREKDVEALFDLVHVGTPVEITYNRVVVEKAPDDTWYIMFIRTDMVGRSFGRKTFRNGFPVMAWGILFPIQILRQRLMLRTESLPLWRRYIHCISMAFG